MIEENQKPGVFIEIPFKKEVTIRIKKNFVDVFNPENNGIILGFSSRNKSDSILYLIKLLMAYKFKLDEYMELIDKNVSLLEELDQKNSRINELQIALDLKQ